MMNFFYLFFIYYLFVFSHEVYSIDTPKFRNNIVSDKLHFPQFKNDDLITVDLSPELKNDAGDILYNNGQLIPKFRKALDNDKDKRDKKNDNSTSVSQKNEQNAKIIDKKNIEQIEANIEESNDDSLTDNGQDFIKSNDFDKLHALKYWIAFENINHLAMFKYFEWFWLVIEGSIDDKKIDELFNNKVDYYEIYQKPNNITIIRFKSPFNPKIIKNVNNINGITIDLNAKENKLLSKRTNLKPIKYDDNLWINYPGFYNNIIKIKIPEDGRELNILLGGKEIGGIVDIYDYPLFTLLPSIHGIVIDYKDDTLPVTILLDGVSIGLKYDLLPKNKEFNNYSKFFYRPCQWEKLNKSHNFYNDKVKLFNKVLTSSIEDVVDNRLNIVKFYLFNNMYSEALSYIKYLLKLEQNYNEINYGFSILYAISLYLNGRYKEADTIFYSTINSDEYLLLSEKEQIELKIWHIAANIKLWVDISQDILHDFDKITPFLLESILECYTEDDKISFLLLFFKQSIHRKQLEKIQKLREILDNKKMSSYENNEYLINLAKFLIDTGEPDLARDLYSKVKNSKDYIHHLVARFMIIKYDYEKKIISTAEAIAGLVNIKKEAPNNVLFLAELLEYLGDLYLKEGDYYNALYTLNSARNAYNSQSIVDITRKIGYIFLYVFNHNGHMKLTSKQIVELFIDFKNFISISDQGVYSTLTYIDALEKLNLVDDTIKELNHLVKYRLYGAERIDALSRLFSLILKSDKVGDIINIYNELDPTTMLFVQDNIKIMSMVGKALALQDYKKGIKLLDDIKGKNISTLQAKSNILWSSKDYTGIIRLLQDLLIYRDNSYDPLTLFEYESIYRLATAYLAMNERVSLITLYNAYKDFFNQDNIYYIKLIKLFGKVVDINKKDDTYIKDLYKLTNTYQDTMENQN